MTQHRNDWRLTVLLFALTGLVESLAFGHLGAFTPLYLKQLGVADNRIVSWTGILSSLGFVIGLPLLPFWGVWADRYGRKLIIIRSSVAGALLFAVAGASTNVWMLAGARFLSGFVLGNTGIMMAVQAEITPRERLGTAISVISAGSPVGMAVGPYVGGLLIRAIGIRHLLFIDAGLTALVALCLLLFLREEPRDVPAHGSTTAGIMTAFRAIAHTPIVLRLFGVVFITMFGLNAAQPYLPILIEHLFHGPRPNLAPTIGSVLTISGITMAVMTPLWGTIGDRVGHRRMLQFCVAAVAITLFGLARAHSVEAVTLWRGAQGLFQGGIGSLAMVLLALYTPKERRASVLTLSLLPHQFAWFLGPLLSSALAQQSISLAFVASGACVLLGGIGAATLPAAHQLREEAAAGA